MYMLVFKTHLLFLPKQTLYETIQTTTQEQNNTNKTIQLSTQHLWGFKKKKQDKVNEEERTVFV